MRKPVARFWVNAALLSGAIATAFPLVWMISVSFMPTGAAGHYPPPLLPVKNRRYTSGGAEPAASW